MKKFYLVLSIIVASLVAAALLIQLISFVYNKKSQSVNMGDSVFSPPSVEVKKGLVVENVKAGDIVSSPLQIIGYVNGDGWIGFEGQVGNVTLQDNAGNVLDIEPLTATSEWMTTTVRFEANLEFVTNAVEGKLVFRNENPSGEPSRERQVSLNIKFGGAAETMKLQAYFSNSRLDPKITCERVFPVTRTVPKTVGVARAALEEMLKGPTAQEQAAGYVTNINEGVRINSVTIENGVAKVDLSEELQREVGGSCRVTAIRAQIVETLNQFSTVKSVVISVEGKTEDVLQP